MASVKLNLPSTLHVLDFTVIVQTFIKYPMYYENNWKATWRKSDPEKGSIALLFHHRHSYVGSARFSTAATTTYQPAVDLFTLLL